MEKTKEHGISWILGLFLNVAFFSLVAYFFYGKNISPVFGIALFVFILEAIFLLSYIPIFGLITAIVISKFIFIPLVLQYVGLEESLLTSVIFYWVVFNGVVVTLSTLSDFAKRQVKK